MLRVSDASAYVNPTNHSNNHCQQCLLVEATEVSPVYHAVNTCDSSASLSQRSVMPS